MQPLPTESSSDVDGEMGWERRPYNFVWTWRSKLLVVSAGCMVFALVAISRSGQSRGPQFIHSNAQFMSAASSCGSAPDLDGRPLNSLIESTSGILIVANPRMRCTQAVESALQAKAMSYTLKKFEAPFQYTEGVSEVWDWLHCSYPDDTIGGGTVMHSYVFSDGTFVGEGFKAAAQVAQGSISGPTDGQTCEDRFAEQAAVLKKFQEDPTNKVLLFGWLACECTGIAQARFAADSVCYNGRTWANPNSDLMAYLQCKEGSAEDHSFVYFRNTDGWDFAGNGFLFDDRAMPQDRFDSLVTASKADKDCHHANVKVNVFGTPLEECRTELSDMMGSWQDDGTCSEQVGGIHEICIESLPGDFSTETHQPPWSEERADKRHCVCVGAWSLYMTDAAKHPENAAKIMPHCKSIPETALTERYLENWKDWNGYPANIIDGVGKLVERCLGQVSEQKLQCGLRKRFEAMRDKVPDLGGSDLQELQDRFQQLNCPSKN